MKAARRARQIGATALQIFSDNPTAWRRRSEPPPDAPAFVAYCAREEIGPVAIHASYLINLAGSAEPFASQSLAGLIYEMRRAPAYGASMVNTHIGSHRGGGSEAGLGLLWANVSRVLAETAWAQRSRSWRASCKGSPAVTIGLPSAWIPPTCGAPDMTSQPSRVPRQCSTASMPSSGSIGWP
jgi:endonuclease IV